MKPMRNKNIWLWVGAALVLIVAAGLAYWLIPGLGRPPVVPAPESWPTHGWQVSTPEEQGIDSVKLAEGLQAIRENELPIHSLLLIRDGKVVVDAYFYPYDGRTPHNIASITKSLMTSLIGIAIDQGILSLDDRLVSFFPEQAIANPDQRKSKITIRSLASMSAGMECSGLPDELTVMEMEASPDWVQFALDRPMVADPGTRWEYCGLWMHLLSAILEKAAGMPALEFASQNLFEPLGIQNVVWPVDPQGISLGAGNVRLLPLDMAKLGLLWLQDGAWDGRQIVSQSWVRSSVKPYFQAGDEGYGYGWWISSYEGSPVYNAVGVGGQHIAIDRRLNIVLVTTGGGFEFDDALVYLLPSLVDMEQPLPPSPDGVALLQAAVAAVAQPPGPQPVPPLPEMAGKVSGRTYQFEQNMILLKTLRLDFDSGSTAVLQLEFSDGRQTPAIPVGLDGVYRLTTGLDLDRAFHSFVNFSELAVGLRGAWVDAQTFQIEYDTLANRYFFQLNLQFDQDRVTLDATERGSSSRITFAGKAQNP